jgi:hypothetical protein
MKKMLFLRRTTGGMAEWSNAAVLKTVVRLPVDRGFESLFLRQPLPKEAALAASFLFGVPADPGLPKGDRRDK